MSKNDSLESRNMYQQLISNIPAGFALHEIICNDKGEPLDYRFLEVNPAFEKLTGLRAEDIIGKTCLEVLPGTEPIWFEKYGQVALTGETTHFASFSSVLNRHYEVTAFQTAPCHFACVFHDVTDYIAEAELKEKNIESLRLSETLTGIGYFERNWQTGEGFWSEGFYKLLGESSEKVDCTHAGFMKYVHKNDQKRVTEHIQSTIKDHTDMDIEFRVVQVNGNNIYIHGRATNIYDEFGKPLSTIGTFLDITDRKRTEEKIKKNEVRYTELVNTINSGVAVYKVINNGDFGKDYIIEDFNKTALEIENLQKEDLVGKSLVDIRPKIDDYGLIPVFQKVWKTGEPAFFPAKIYVDDNYSNYYENRVFRLPDGNIVAIYDDVTDRENAVFKMQQNKERLDLALNATQDGIYDWNLITDEIYYSPPWKRMLGYEDNELPNDFSVWERLTDMEGVKKSMKMLQEVVSRDRDYFEIEFKMKHKKGHWVDILSRAKAVFNEEGKAVRVIGTHVDISERKKANETLIDSEEKYRSLVEGSLQGMVVAQNNPVRILFASSPMERISGYSPDEIVSFSPKELTELIYKDDREEFFKSFSDRITGKNVEPNRKYRLIHKNGNIVWVELYSTLIKYDGEPAVQTVFIDITGRKKSEEDIKAKNIFLESLIQQSPLPTFVLDSKGNNVMVNKAFLKFYAVPDQKTILGKNALTDPANISHGMVKYFKEALSGKVVEMPEIEFTAPYNNKKAITKCKLFPIFDPKGKLTNIVAMQEDITGSKQAAEALLENQKRYEKAQEMGHVGNWEYDPVTTLFWASDEAKRIYGFDVGTRDFSTEKVEQCIPERERVHQALIDLLENDKKYDLIFDIITNDKGTRKTIHSIAEVEKDAKGSPIKVTGVISDITEKKNLEESMHRSQKLESLGILAGGIAHDFNNILSAIFGYTEMAIMKSGKNEVSSYLDKSISNIERARALTQQLLTFAKGGAPVKKVENIFAFIQETIKFALSGSSVSSQFKIEDNLWACDIDKNQIGQVIDNLTINAQQAMPNGGEIEVSAQNMTLADKEHPVLVAGNYVKLSITDHGIGIPKEFLPKIFDPYYTTKPKGHGLGLATCYSIITRHNGSIDVKSEPGKGSTFNIYLPATIDTISTKDEKSIKKHIGSGTFLVMDDDKAILELMKEMLESIGYDVVVKTNGEDALAFFATEFIADRKISGMIFDLTIPGGMGGKEAIKEIRRICSKTPVFVSSGYSEDPIISNPEEYGFNASIRKPFMLSDLSEMLEKHMNEKQEDK